MHGWVVGWLVDVHRIASVCVPCGHDIHSIDSIHMYARPGWMSSFVFWLAGWLAGHLITVQRRKGEGKERKGQIAALPACLRAHLPAVCRHSSLMSLSHPSVCPPACLPVWLSDGRGCCWSAHTYVRICQRGEGGGTPTHTGMAHHTTHTWVVKTHSLTHSQTYVDMIRQVMYVSAQPDISVRIS